MSETKKITILNFDLSDNSLGRAHLIAEMLKNDFEVEILGPTIKGDIWEPFQQSDIPITATEYAKFPLLIFKLPAILKKINGDVVYAIKPRFMSFGIGLLKKLTSGRPLILDIDDWEVGFYYKKGFWSRFLKILNLSNPNSLPWTWFLQFFIRFSDRKTTVSTFLQKKYGGDIVPHAKDTDLLDPDRFEKNSIKEEQHLEGKKIVMFLGTPRKHKGVEDAVSAVNMIEDHRVLLVVVGCNLGGSYEEHLRQMGGERLRLVGKVPISALPYYLSMADIVVVPQRKTTDTAGQIPSKLFDAMAMAKPIISTNVSDIPLILSDCGIIVEPEDTVAIKEEIESLLKDSERSKLLGRNARQRCIDNYSFTVLRELLVSIAGGIFEK